MVKRHEDKEDKAQYLRLLSPKVWEDLFRLNFFFLEGGGGGGVGGGGVCVECDLTQEGSREQT